LLFEPRVMVTSVPWQLRSSARVVQREQLAPGAVRWGLDTGPAGTSGNATPVDGASAGDGGVTGDAAAGDLAAKPQPRRADRP
jgi:hypothetical protein